MLNALRQFSLGLLVLSLVLVPVWASAQETESTDVVVEKASDEKASDEKKAEDAPTEKATDAPKTEKATDAPKTEAGADKPAKGSILKILNLKKQDKDKARADKGAKSGTTKPAAGTTKPAAGTTKPAADLKPAAGTEKKKAAATAAEKKAAAAAKEAAARAEAVKAVQAAIKGEAPVIFEEGHDHEHGTTATEATKVEETEEAKPKKKKAPLPPMFWMADGTRLAGIPEVHELHVQTAYGPLTIPVSEITRLRFCEPKKEEGGGGVEDLIQQLGHEEFDLREEAMDKIRKLGSKSVPALKKGLKTDDEEIKNRLEKLIGELEEEEEEIDEDALHTVRVKGLEDEIVTFQFTVMGKVQESSFLVNTKYGKLSFSREHIVSIVFREPLISKETFTVQGSNIAGQKRWVDTGIELAKGAPYTLNASGNINLSNYGVSCGPEGTSGAPARFEKFPAGALVAKIGNGKAFLVGSSFDGKATAKGKLFLAIAMQSSNATGSYEVELQRPNE